MNIPWLLFSFRGRIGRLPYWIFSLVFLVGIYMPALSIVEHGSIRANEVMLTVVLLSIWPGLAIQAKRWHDRNKSAWWILINAAPIVGPIWALVENGFLPGTESENRFG